jgi:hypothetical protein
MLVENDIKQGTCLAASVFKSYDRVLRGCSFPIGAGEGVQTGGQPGCRRYPCAKGDGKVAGAFVVLACS